MLLKLVVAVTYFDSGTVILWQLLTISHPGCKMEVCAVPAGHTQIYGGRRASEINSQAVPMGLAPLLFPSLKEAD